jgi:hypothetical protein
MFLRGKSDIGGQCAKNISVQLIEHFRAVNDLLLILAIGDPVHQFFKKLNMFLIKCAV